MKTPPTAEYLVLHPEFAPRFIINHLDYNVSRHSALQTVRAAAELAGRSQEKLKDLVKVQQSSGYLREQWELRGIEIPNRSDVLLTKESKAVIDLVSEDDLSSLTDLFARLEPEKLRQINFKGSGQMNYDLPTWLRETLPEVPVFGAFNSKTGNAIGLALPFQIPHDHNTAGIGFAVDHLYRTPVVMISLLGYLLIAGHGQFHRFEAHVSDSDAAAIAAFRYYHFEEKSTGNMVHFYLELKTPEDYAGTQ